MIKQWAMWWVRNRVQLWLNMILGAYFLAMIPISLATGLKHSVPFLVAISLWALVAAHWSAALAAYAAEQASTPTPIHPSEDGPS